MPRKAVNARASKNEAPAEDRVDAAGVLRLIGWMVLATAFCVCAAALVSYDASDPPSPHVAVQNAEVQNWCGGIGATIAHHAYHIFGVGSWVILAGVLGWLVAIAAGRVVTHPLVPGVVLHRVPTLLVSLSQYLNR